MAKENGATQLALVGRTHIQAWVEGTVPDDPQTPVLLAQTFTRRLGRPVLTTDLGLGVEAPDCEGDLWDTDTLIALTDLGRRDLSMDRRHALSALAYQVTTLALPHAPRWSASVGAQTRRPVSGRRVGQGDLAAVRDVIDLFSQMDQRRGGGHGRSSVVQYLTTEVEPLLHGRFATNELRQNMFSAAGELAYLSGWMAFDASEHGLAQHYFANAVKLAAEADDAPLVGHVLRAMAHQANDLGHHRAACHVAAASIEGARYREASHRERALLGVVHARTLAATGDAKGAATALNRAEDDLARAEASRGDEPRRVWFFQEASLAHETACTLRDSGHLDAAISQFRRSARTRQAAFPRTHAVTLGYLGALQAQQGGIEQACSTWARALDLMDGVRSGRTVQTARQMRQALSPYRPRGISAVREVDARAAAYLAHSI
ncbi:Tat pathway signal protein [Streptacidiphilus griseoplanus]|uniref:Tat pathway signal protein n=1 Tax=Peterkaempfera griseoplana TaxID=66896 RepID=UPI001FDEA83B|nr:Tat pathway signal protein [Peterkaempfera griseoplana]